MNPPPLGGVIFDMDGLLFDTETLGRRAWGQALSEFGHALTDTLYLSMVGRDLAARERLLRAHFGQELPFEAIKRRRLELGEAQELGEGLPLKPGAGELVRALHARGLPLAVATGTEAPRARRRLNQAGLAVCFEALVTSEEVAQGKPAPDIFLEAARRLGLPPAACLVFEDSRAGVAAAAAAGCQVIMVPDLEQPAVDTPARVLPALSAALPMLCEWFGPAR